MRRHRTGERLVLLGLVLAGTLGAWAAETGTEGAGFRIQGIPAVEPLSGPVRRHQWEGNEAVLQVGSGTLRVSPWPTELERGPLKGLTARASSLMHPEGPSLRLELASAPQARPHLVLGSRARIGLELLPGWRVEPAGQDATELRLAGPKSTRVVLAPHQAAVLRQGAETWCVRLVAIHAPTATEPGLARESTEPRFDWVATRVTRQLASTCAQP